MAYSVNFKKHAFKELAKINEPFYSQIKQAIYTLQITHALKAAKNLKEGTVTASE